MKLQTGGSTPIYLQIAHWLETEILTGAFKEHDKVYSQYQLADMLNINPATAAKGLNVLAADGIVYDKRGLGKFVAEDAREQIKEKRKNGFIQELVAELVEEAMHLHLDKEEVMDVVERMYEEKREKNDGRY